MTGRVIDHPEAITAEWIRRALGTEVRDVTVQPVGTGQIGAMYRVTADGLERPLLVKLPTPEVGTREMLAGAYRSEVRFYTCIAPTVGIRVPRVYLAEMDDDDVGFTVVMEDLHPSVQGDQLLGCSRAHAVDAVVNLAGLHGPRWCDESLLEIDGLTRNGPDEADMLVGFYEPAVEMFLDNLAGHLASGTSEVVRRTVPAIAAWELGRRERFGLVHGDYRLDNLMFPPGGATGVHAVDWQTLSIALPARDLAFFTGTSLEPAARREWEAELVSAYHEALVGHGVRDHSLDECWEDYRFSMLQGILVSVLGSAYGSRTERGDAMFAAMADRSAAAITDLGSLDLIA